MTRPDLSSQAYKRSPHATLARLVEEGPFCEIRLPLFGPVLCVTRHAAIQALLKDADHFAVDARNAGHRSAFGLPFLPKVFRTLANNILSLDDPDHTLKWIKRSGLRGGSRRCPSACPEAGAP